MKKSVLKGILIGFAALLFHAMPAVAEKPEAALNSVSVIGDVSQVHERMIYNQLQSQLSERYDLVPKAVFEKALEKMKEELDAEQCTEENCIRSLQDILQVERLFTLMILKSGSVTQLSLVLVTNERRIPKSGTCSDCSISQLLGKIRTLTNTVVNDDQGVKTISGGNIISRMTPSAGSGPAGGRIEIIQPKLSGDSSYGVAALSFDSNPSGAVVYLGDTEAGLTPFYDDTLKPDQQILITVNKEDYYDKRLQVMIKGGINDLGTIALKPAFGSLAVSSQPSEADVYLAGQKVGTTPYRAEQLSSKAYMLDVKKPFYLDEKIRIVIRDEQTTEKNFKLRPDFGELKIDARPAGAEIRILDKNQKEVSRVKSPATLRLKPGNYSFQLEKTGYRTITGKLAIARNETWEITPSQATLIKQEGKLMIGTDPYKKGAEIHVDGQKLVGTVPAQVTLPAGSHKISVKSGEYSGSMTVDVIDGRTLPVKIKLQKGGGLQGDDLVFVKGGCFQMGDTFGEGQDDEKPVHEVCVDDYYIGKHEVTQGQWQRIMGNNPSSFKNGDNFPVEQVSWTDVQTFIQKLNNKTGGKYRLPTEAEWEYACREGGRKVRFGNGKDIIDPDEANLVGSYRRKTTAVGNFQPNSLGLYDMSGNVWEWVSDWYDGYYYRNSLKDNPKGPSTGSERVFRGGSWLSSPRLLRCADRGRGWPSDRSDNLGFRLARTP